MNIVKTISMITILFLTGACSCYTVDPGHVGVLVHTRGGEQGETEIRTMGRHYEGYYTDLYQFPIFKQTRTWTANIRPDKPMNEEFVFQTSEGLEVRADIGVTFEIIPDKVQTLFQKYRKGIDEITDIYVRNQIRDALTSHSSNLKVEEIYGTGRNALLEAVTQQVRANLEPEGILIEQVYWVGPARLPNQVREAIDSKIAATQRAEQRENELREAEAEGQKMIAKTQAEVEALRLRTSAISSTTIEYERLMNARMAIEKWNGVMPQTVAGGNIPFVMDMP